MTTIEEKYDTWEKWIDRTIKAVLVIGILWIINTSNQNDTVNQLQEQRLVKVELEIDKIKEDIRDMRSNRYTDTDAKRDIAPIKIDLQYIKADIQEIKSLLKK